MGNALGFAALVLAVAGIGVLADFRFRPYQRCPSCRDRPGKGRWSTGEVWNDCRRCGGTGKRIRRGSRVLYRKWREEARRR